ncbi:MAG: hypothetical protein ACMUJM_25400, partial [bacterium]
MMKIKITFTLLTLLVLTFILLMPSFAEMSSTSFRSPAQVVNGGGEQSSSENLKLIGGVGLSTPLGLSQSSSFLCVAGFIPQLSEVNLYSPHLYVESGESIQEAIYAAEDTDVIIVEPGTYQENINYLGKAITIQSIDPEDPEIVSATIIDGGQAGRVVTFNNGEGSDSILKGVTITNGVASSGGGIYCNNSSPTIVKCTISKNTATSNGGGMWSKNCSPVITSCTISENAAQTYGGGLYYENGTSVMITDCTINGNSSSSQGGGIYCNATTATISTCTILENASPRGAGGYFSQSTISMSQCDIVANSASTEGGGIHCNSSSATISICTFSENSSKLGGGIYSVSKSSIITNCIIAANAASENGGGMYCNYANSPITNCTVVRNTASAGAGIYCRYSTPVIKNSIFWHDTPVEIAGTHSPTVTYSNIRSGHAGTGNISTQPWFVDYGAGDYHLSPLSPCVDSG